MILGTREIMVMLKEINSTEEIERRANEFKNYQVYEGKLRKFVKASVQEKYPRTHKDYTVASYNLLKKITNKKAKAYKKAPSRKLDKDTETKSYADLIKKAKLNQAMKLVDRYHNQHRYCAIGVIRDREVLSENKVKDSFSFWALAPHEFVVHRDLNGNIYGWSIPTGRDKDYNYWTMWTKESHIKIKTKNYTSFEIVPHVNNPNFINPYGIIPFIYVPADSSGVYPETSTLVEDSIEVNTNLSVYLTSGNMQIGQLVIKHPSGQTIENVTMGLRTALDLPQHGDGQTKTEAEYIAPSPNLEGHKNSILLFMQLILDENGLTNAKVGAAEGETFTSGFDRLISNADVQDIIEENQGIYVEVENDIYQIIKAMHLKDNMHTFTAESLNTVFTIPEIMLADSEKLDNLGKKKSLGLWFLWELILEANPNLTIDEAKEKATELKKEQQEERKYDLERQNFQIS